MLDVAIKPRTPSGIPCEPFRLHINTRHPSVGCQRLAIGLVFAVNVCLAATPERRPVPIIEGPGQWR
jgi:hypothetical protein